MPSTGAPTLPHWPAAMRKELAAAYLDISPRAFATLVSSRAIVGRKVSDRSVRYLRAELDVYLESLPRGQGPRPDTH